MTETKPLSVQLTEDTEREDRLQRLLQNPTSVNPDDIIQVASEATAIPAILANFESEIDTLYAFTDEDVDDRLAFDRYLAAAMQALLVLDTGQDMTPYDVVTEAAAMAIEGVHQRRTILEQHRETLVAKSKPTKVLVTAWEEGGSE